MRLPEMLARNQAHPYRREVEVPLENEENCSYQDAARHRRSCDLVHQCYRKAVQQTWHFAENRPWQHADDSLVRRAEEHPYWRRMKLPLVHASFQPEWETYVRLSAIPRYNGTCSHYNCL